MKIETANTDSYRVNSLLLTFLLLLTVCFSGYASGSTPNASVKKCLADTTIVKSYGNSYGEPYPVQPGYTDKEKSDIEKRNTEKNAVFMAAMIKDKLITDTQNVSFKIGHEGFFVNGVKQPDAVFEKYRQAYVPKPAQTGEWSWTYSINQAVK